MLTDRDRLKRIYSIATGKQVIHPWTAADALAVIAGLAAKRARPGSRVPHRRTPARAFRSNGSARRAGQRV